MTTPRRNSIAAMGFEAYANEHYTKYAGPGKTAFQTIGEDLDRDDNDSRLARKYNRTQPTIRQWRIWYNEIKTKGL